MHDFDRRADRIHVRFRQRPPAAADRIEHRPCQRARQARAQNFVDLPLRRRNALGQHGFDWQRAERQADPAIPDLVIDRFRNFEAAPAHVADRADRPEEARNHAEGREPRFLSAAEDAHLEARLRLDRLSEFRSVRSAAHGLRRDRVDSADPHGLGNGAKSPHRLDRPTKMVRRDCAGFRQPFRESGKRFFIEARHRRAAELVIDQEPDRVRADVDDRVGASDDVRRAHRVQLKRPQRLSRAVRTGASPSGLSPLRDLS